MGFGMIKMSEAIKFNYSTVLVLFGSDRLSILWTCQGRGPILLAICFCDVIMIKIRLKSVYYYGTNTVQ